MSQTNVPTNRGETYADLILRVVAGGFLVPHGAQKRFAVFGGGGIEGTTVLMEKIGFPMPVVSAWLAGSIELVGGALLMLGLATRVAGLVFGIFLLAAARVVAEAELFWIGGGYEYALMWSILCLAYVVKGGGPYSLDTRLLRKGSR